MYIAKNYKYFVKKYINLNIFYQDLNHLLIKILKYTLKCWIYKYIYN